MIVGIHLRQVTIQNLFYVNNVEVKWVNDPYDLGEASPKVIGIIGTNGSGKSTILSTAIPWLIHPESNKFAETLTESIFYSEVPSLSVMIIFEYEGHIYDAKRHLIYHRANQEWSYSSYSLYRCKKGVRDNVTSSWDNIFGKDTGTPQPYVCEHHNLAKIARKMASDNGLRDFSENLGHHELLDSLKRLDIKKALDIDSAESSTLTGPHKKQFDELRKGITGIDNELKTKKERVVQLKQLEENFRISHGDYENFYTDFHAVAVAEGLHDVSKNRKEQAIRNFITDDTLVNSTLAKLKLHFEDRYGVKPESLPSSDVSDNMVKSAKSFKRLHEEIYNRISATDKTELERIILAVENLDMTLVKNSDPDTMGEEVFNFKSKIRDEQKAAQHVKHVNRNSLSDKNITKATLDAWTEARTERNDLKPIINHLKSQQSSFAALKSKITTHDEAKPKIEAGKKIRKSISILQEILKDSVVDFEKKTQTEMLLSAEKTLNKIYHYEEWKITQIAETIHPIKNEVQLDFAKVGLGGPSAGQARTIALCIMVERYLKTRCKIPLILDDAFKDISEESDIGSHLRTAAETHTLHRAVENGHQVIWANITNPISSDAVLARITTKEGAHSNKALMGPPWNGKPVVGISVGGGN